MGDIYGTSRSGGRYVVAVRGGKQHKDARDLSVEWQTLFLYNVAEATTFP